MALGVTTCAPCYLYTSFQKNSKGIAIMHSVEQSCWRKLVSLLFLVLLVRWDPWTCMMVYWVIRLYRLQVDIQVLILGYITFEPPIFLLGEQLKNVELSVYYSSYLWYHLKLIVFNPVKSLCRYWCVDQGGSYWWRAFCPIFHGWGQFGSPKEWHSCISWWLQ